MEDQLDKNRSVYDVSAGEVFWKNFLAGFGRALGGIFIYAIFITICVYIFMTQALPHITPFIQEYQQAVRGLNLLNKTTAPSTGSDLKQYQQFLQDLPITPSK